MRLRSERPKVSRPRLPPKVDDKKDCCQKQSHLIICLKLENSAAAKPHQFTSVPVLVLHLECRLNKTSNARSLMSNASVGILQAVPYSKERCTPS
ncbi:hypothetical protein Tco_0214089 [Tanacetum coccineum]